MQTDIFTCTTVRTEFGSSLIPRCASFQGHWHGTCLPRPKQYTTGNTTKTITNQHELERKIYNLQCKLEPIQTVQVHELSEGDKPKHKQWAVSFTLECWKQDWKCWISKGNKRIRSDFKWRTYKVWLHCSNTLRLAVVVADWFMCWGDKITTRVSKWPTLSSGNRKINRSSWHRPPLSSGYPCTPDTHKCSLQ